ncbi:hypothetical protein CIHG_06877 [Coccidioides immitis H538.4]|uniref:Uncharacterized protein n=3 Tax=Coccidioides immitis TaxID=5501 RepID=A0A0J8QYH0_COCIT|nr:hypothetical protein CIRG_04432 [Coccidioides immitis RMSCC 2394]KMU77516.1 hypothetical protein CISG_06518 [Coccidioides immitis RMSCC 3703]KMU89075.1 hypothetical protein CIHG_06877 [Coccidioides immitis H538.4]
MGAESSGPPGVGCGTPAGLLPMSHDAADASQPISAWATEYQLWIFHAKFSNQSRFQISCEAVALHRLIYDQCLSSLGYQDAGSEPPSSCSQSFDMSMLRRSLSL